MSTAAGVDEAPVKQLAKAVVDLAQDLDASSWCSLVRALRLADCRAEALQVGRFGIRRFPESADLYLEQGRLLAESRDFSGAIASLGQALHRAPDSPEALWLAASVHHQLGLSDEARGFVERLLRLLPEHQAARDLLNQLTPAAPKTREPVETGDRRTISTPTLAEIFVKQGYLSKAIQIYEDLLGRDPGNARWRERLRQLQADIAAPAAGSSELRVLSEPVPEPSVISLAQAPASPSAVVPATAVASAENRLLGTLEGWLEAIDRRRQHVH